VATDAGRLGDRQRRPPVGLQRAGEGDDRDAARGLPAPYARPDRVHQLARDRLRQAAEPGLDALRADAADRPRAGAAARACAARRERLHRRPRAGGVADRRVDRQVRGRGREMKRFPELVVFVAGIVTLGAEIAAARLVAPAFGASTVVWANTIAVVLIALAGGYWLRGRGGGRGAGTRGGGRAGGPAAGGGALLPPRRRAPPAGGGGCVGRAVRLLARAAGAGRPAGARPRCALAVGDPAARQERRGRG